MLQVGLTGGIASGKSTAAGILTDLGATVIDADAIAREVVETGSPGLAAVVEEFGVQVVRPDGSLDRPALGRIVFADDDARARLNAIVHPLVRAQTQARVASLPESAIVVHDVPLIVEKQMGAQYHLVVVIGADEETRRRRAVARGLPEADARARIAAQADDDARRRAADVWISNESTAAQLRASLEQLWHARLVPFADNIRARRPARPQQLPAVSDEHRITRLISRLEHASQGDLTQVSCTDASDHELVLTGVWQHWPVDREALVDAGFVPISTSTFASADPGCPARLELLTSGQPTSAAARA